MMIPGVNYLTRTYDMGLGERRVRHSLKTGITVFNHAGPELTKRQRAVLQYDAQKELEQQRQRDVPGIRDELASSLIKQVARQP